MIVGHAQISSAIEYRSHIVSSGNRDGKFGRESLSRRWVRRSGQIDAGQWRSHDVDTAARGLVVKKKRVLEPVPLVDYRYANLREFVKAFRNLFGESWRKYACNWIVITWNNLESHCTVFHYTVMKLCIV